MKYFLFSFTTILIINDALTSTSIECSYSSKNYDVFVDIYHCSVSNIPSITTQESAIISSIKGTHEITKTNDDVLGFRAQSKTIHFFPLALEKHFKNIKLIHFETCPIKQLRQSDLMKYTKLEYLSILSSDLAILEAGTFDYNPELQFINFGHNKFLNIDSSAFTSLKKLTYLYLNSVPCINKFARLRIAVDDIISQLKTKCKNPIFYSLHQKFKNLESQPKTLDFKENLEVFEREYKATGFSSNPLLKTRMEALKSAKIDNTATQLTTKVDPMQQFCESYYQNVTQDMKVKDLESLKDENPEIENKSVEIMTSVTDHDLKLANIQESPQLSQSCTADSFKDVNANIVDLKAFQDEIMSSQNDTRVAINDLRESQKSLKSSQDGLKSSQDEVLNNLSDMKTTISDVESSLSKIKASQNELQSSINKLRLTQNELGIAIDKIGKNEENDGKIEKVENHLMDFEAKTNEHLEQIKQDLANARHKMEVNFDEKIKGIEKRLSKKFEDILEEKLVKILEIRNHN